MIGVFTAGEAGASREYRYFGVREFTDAVRAWSPVADLEDLGLFCYSNGENWEIRVSGLSTNRTDSHGRRLQNTVVVQGAAISKEPKQQARRLAEAFLSDPSGLAELIDGLVSEDRVESWFRGDRFRQDELAEALSDFPPSQGDPADLVSGLEGANQPLANRHLKAAIEALVSGQRGVAISGHVYGDAKAAGRALSAIEEHQPHSVAYLSAIGADSPVQPLPLSARSDPHPKAPAPQCRSTRIIRLILWTASLGGLVAFATILWRLLRR